MNILDALFLGGIQGITEFLPISSSGHLVLAESLLGLQVETLKSFDVVVHLGTLLAILVYFWQDVKGMIFALLRILKCKIDFNDPYTKLMFYIGVATIPAVIAGLFGEKWIDSNFRNVPSVAISMICVGLIFIWGEHFYKQHHKNDSHVMVWYKAIVIGLAQAVALLPGVSRSGSTIVAGLFQGIDRSSAARFSFLMGIPAIAGAGLLTALKISPAAMNAVGSLSLLLGFVAAFIFGLVSVKILMSFLKNHSLNLFAFYLIVLGLSVILKIL